MRARYPNGNPQDATGICFSKMQYPDEACRGYLGAEGPYGPNLPSPEAAVSVSNNLNRGKSPTRGCSQCTTYGTFKYSIYPPPEVSCEGAQKMDERRDPRTFLILASLTRATPCTTSLCPAWAGATRLSSPFGPRHSPGLEGLLTRSLQRGPQRTGVAQRMASCTCFMEVGGDGVLAPSVTRRKPQSALFFVPSNHSEPLHAGLWGGWQYQLNGMDASANAFTFGYGGYQEARG